MNKTWFIPYNVPSLKNSKVKTKVGIFPSKTVRKYLQELGIQAYSPTKRFVKEYKTRPNLFREALKDFPQDLEYPIKLGLHFVRDNKRKFDFNNISQILFDLMTAHNFIMDDNMDYLIPFPLEIDGKYYSINKENPGVILKILNP